MSDESKPMPVGDKTKGLAALIVDKMPKVDAAAEEAEKVAGDMNIVCEDMMNAIESKDVAAFRSALEAFLEMR